MPIVSVHTLKWRMLATNLSWDLLRHNSSLADSRGLPLFSEPIKSSSQRENLPHLISSVMVNITCAVPPNATVSEPGNWWPRLRKTFCSHRRIQRDKQEQQTALRQPPISQIRRGFWWQHWWIKCGGVCAAARLRWCLMGCKSTVEICLFTPEPEQNIKTLLESVAHSPSPSQAWMI